MRRIWSRALKVVSLRIGSRFRLDARSGITTPFMRVLASAGKRAVFARESTVHEVADEGHAVAFTVFPHSAEPVQSGGAWPRRGLVGRAARCTIHGAH